MRKIVTRFLRNNDGDHLVRDEVTPGTEWVEDKEAIATRKFDGTCCRWKDGRLWKRRELKRYQKKPIDFVPASEPDPVTGKQPGWVQVEKTDYWHREALHRAISSGAKFFEDQTFELVGPKVNGNPERFIAHELVPHGAIVIKNVPTDFYGLQDFLIARDIEGIVWHHPDGRMVKIKAKDFGIARGVK